MLCVSFQFASQKEMLSHLIFYFLFFNYIFERCFLSNIFSFYSNIFTPLLSPKSIQTYISSLTIREASGNIDFITESEK